MCAAVCEPCEKCTSCSKCCKCGNVEEAPDVMIATCGGCGEEDFDMCEKCEDCPKCCSCPRENYRVKSQMMKRPLTFSEALKKVKLKDLIVQKYVKGSLADCPWSERYNDEIATVVCMPASFYADLLGVKTAEFNFNVAGEFPYYGETHEKSQMIDDYEDITSSLFDDSPQFFGPDGHNWFHFEIKYEWLQMAGYPTVDEVSVLNGYPYENILLKTKEPYEINTGYTWEQENGDSPQKVLDAPPGEYDPWTILSAWSMLTFTQMTNDKGKRAEDCFPNEKYNLTNSRPLSERRMIDGNLLKPFKKKTNPEERNKKILEAGGMLGAIALLGYAFMKKER